MSQTLVAVTGVSGVGKTTVLNKLAATLDFQLLRASALISEAGGRTEHAGLRSNAASNQELLLWGFERARNPSAAAIVLDAHTVLDTSEGIVPIDPAIFASLNIDRLVMLCDDPQAICERREGDASRGRPQRSPAEIAEYQEACWVHCCRIAQILDVPFLLLPMSRTAAELKRLLVSAEPARDGTR